MILVTVSSIRPAVFKNKTPVQITEIVLTRHVDCCCISPFATVPGATPAAGELEACSHGGAQLQEPPKPNRHQPHNNGSGGIRLGKSRGVYCSPQ